MAMVQANTHAVKPGVGAVPPARNGAGQAIIVLLRDSGGRLWRATYRLEPAADGAWRINGCVVAPDDGKSSA
jgi:hypothetical protein